MQDVSANTSCQYLTLLRLGTLVTPPGSAVLPMYNYLYDMFDKRYVVHCLVPLSLFDLMHDIALVPNIGNVIAVLVLNYPTYVPLLS